MLKNKDKNKYKSTSKTRNLMVIYFYVEFFNIHESSNIIRIHRYKYEYIK